MLAFDPFTNFGFDNFVSVYNSFRPGYCSKNERVGRNPNAFWRWSSSQPYNLFKSGSVLILPITWFCLLYMSPVASSPYLTSLGVLLSTCFICKTSPDQDHGLL